MFGIGPKCRAEGTLQRWKNPSSLSRNFVVCSARWADLLPTTVVPPTAFHPAISLCRLDMSAAGCIFAIGRFWHSICVIVNLGLSMSVFESGPLQRLQVSKEREFD